MGGFHGLGFDRDALFVLWHRKVGFERGLPFPPVTNSTADNREEKPGRKSKHEGARQRLKRCEHPPRLRQHEIAEANGRVGNSGKIECKFNIGQAALPEVEQPPDGNLNQMDQNQPARQADHQTGDEPEARPRQGLRPHYGPEQRGEPKVVYAHCDHHQATGDENFYEH